MRVINRDLEREAAAYRARAAKMSEREITEAGQAALDESIRERPRQLGLYGEMLGFAEEAEVAADENERRLDEEERVAEDRLAYFDTHDVHDGPALDALEHADFLFGDDGAKPRDYKVRVKITETW